jgi:hypothetical protein
VGANPEDLRGDVEGCRHVAGQRVQSLDAEGLPKRRGLGDGTVVPVDEPEAQRLATAIDRDHRWALPGQPDGADAAAVPQLLDQRAEGGQ